MNLKLRNTIAVGILGACVAALNIQAQTAVPGPGSTNATVDAQHLDEQHDMDKNLPLSTTRGTETQPSKGESAGSQTPTSGDGSSDTTPESVTQPIQHNSENLSDVVGNCTTLKGSEKEACEREQQEQAKEGEATQLKSHMTKPKK